jgi:hypothetical protein
MRQFLSFLILASVKIVSTLFYKLDQNWLTSKKDFNWSEIKLLIFLNHTSLYEPLYFQALPFSFLWKISKHLAAPGAAKTIERPIVGFFWRLMVPTMTAITRLRDDSWTQFLKSINPESIIVIIPEGRMKRLNGLDVDGNPMTVRGGVAEVINMLDSGKMLLVYSGGLHHIQHPGQHIPKIFKTIKANIEYMDISDYKKLFQITKNPNKEIVADLQTRLQTKCPDF